jgi:predicted MFS family arabinose efflux permease
MRLGQRLGALQERQYRLYFIGQSVSLVGDGMAPLALSFAVLDLTGSVSDLGFVMAARTVAMVACLLLGGVVADRTTPRKVMLGADLVRFSSQAAVAALLIGGQAEVWHLLVLQTVNGAASGFFFPAITALTPTVVSPGRLQQANALRGIASGAGEIVGPPIAGALVATVGSGWAIGADAGTFGVSVLFLARLRPLAREAIPVQSFLHDLHEGWREFRSRDWLVAGVAAAGIGNMCFAAFVVLGAAISKDELGGAGAWALILSAFSIGNLVGGLVALRIRPRRPFFTAFLVYMPFAVPVALLALHAPAPAIAVGACVSGLGLLLGNALWETTLQQQVSPSVLSRVVAYDWFGSLAFQPLGFAIVGPLAEGIGKSPTLWLSAGAMLTVTAWAALLPSVRSIEARPATAEEVSRT